MNLIVKSFYGADIDPYIQELAQLRMIVFRDFPYLYEGSLEYERKYLEIYTQTSQSVIVLAFSDGKIIGAASAMPLNCEADYVKAPFIKKNINIDEIFYFAESVLLKDYRGHGLGHKFFDERESAALKFGFKDAYFCGVERSLEHPMRPKDYRPLDEFWKKRGYEKVPSLISEFSWPDIGETQDSKKKMVYWKKKLIK